MSLRRKLITTIIMISITCVMLFVGVWASNSATVQIGGTVSFVATDVYATITGEITGSSAGTITPTTLEYSSNETPTTEDLNTWKNNLAFDDAGSKITMTITITNLSSQRKLYVTLTDTVGNINNLSKPIKNGANTYKSGTEIEVSKSGSLVFTIEFTVGSTDFSIDGSYGYLVLLEDENVKNT